MNRKESSISAVTAEQAEIGFAGRHQWRNRALLVTYVAICPLVAIMVRRMVGISQSSIWSLQDSTQLLGWLEGLGWLAVSDMLRFIPLGFLAVLSVATARRAVQLGRAATAAQTVPAIPKTAQHHNSQAALSPPSLVSTSRGGAARRTLAALLLAIALTAAVRTIEAATDRRLPHLVGMILPLFGCILGVWLGANWSRGNRFKLVPKFLCLGVVLCVALVAGICLAMEGQPLAFEPVPITSEAKRELVQIFRQADPRDIGEGESQTLSLTTDQLNRLLTWGLTIGSSDRKAHVALEDQSAVLNCSIGLPLGVPKLRYLNVSARGQIEFDDGHFTVRRPAVTVGRVTPPGWLVSVFLSSAVAAVEGDRNAKHLLAAIETVQIERDRITVVLGPMELPAGLASDVFNRMKPGNDVLPGTRVHVQHLIQASGRIPGGEAGFGACLEEAFRLALERSRTGDPVAENRAAIYALGMLLGHYRVQTFVGRAVPQDAPVEALRHLSGVTVRGRGDWTKHFWVSAALALISNQASSDAAGLLKEELDAGRGGSGFSFGDLLADRAGTTFALAATRDAQSARAMQERLAGGFVLDDFFPPASDLPENLPDKLLHERFGGVGGDEYNRVVQEIEQRVARCAAYR